VAPRPFTVAVMQPYFVPYAGYFRLFAAADLFVVYDCVQFPRRGWVHRNKLVDASGAARWLTLPLAKAAQDVLIKELRFPAGAASILAERLRPFGLEAAPADHPVLATLRDVADTPSIYLERLLASVAGHCGLPWNVVRSSTLGLAHDLHGQARILEIARRVGAERYVNPPGGRTLYDAATFEGAGLELRFLADYQGPKVSILQRILRETPQALADEIRAQSVVLP
jgi:hypothetical protein